MNPVARTERRRHSLILLLGSLAAAFLMWLWVQQENSTEVAFTVPVSERNLDENLVLTTQLPQIVVEARGPKEDLDKIDRDKLRVRIDLGRATPANNPNKVRVELDRSGVPLTILWTIRTPNLSVEVQPRVKEPRPVVVETVGIAEEGYTVASLRPTPQTVDLYGLQNEVNKVDRVVAMVDLTEAKRGEPTAVTLRLLDVDGKEVLDKVVVDPDTVLVRAEYVRAAPKRYLPIVPTWKGQLPTGYRFARDHAQSPSQLQVTGDTQALSRLTALETEPIDLTNLKQTRTFTVKVRVPRGVRLQGENVVKITVFVQAHPAQLTKPPTTGGQPD